MTGTAPSERSFGFSVGSVCLGLAAWFWWRGSDTASPTLAAVGFVLVLLAAVAPTLLRVPNRAWWRFALVLGWINSRIILTVFFALVLTPFGLVMRAIGRNPLRARQRGTNWTGYPARITNPHHYERLY